MKFEIKKIWHKEVIARFLLELVEYDREPGYVRAKVTDALGNTGTCCITRGQRCVVKLNPLNPEGTIKWALSRVKKHIPPLLPDQCPGCTAQSVLLMLNCPNCGSDYKPPTV